MNDEGAPELVEEDMDEIDEHVDEGGDELEARNVVLLV